jgi:hypothetical protein
METVTSTTTVICMPSPLQLVVGGAILGVGIAAGMYVTSEGVSLASQAAAAYKKRKEKKEEAPKAAPAPAVPATPAPAAAPAEETK